MASEIEIDSERSRIRNALVNTGRCASFAEADERLASSNIHIHMSPLAAMSPAGQSALLTAVVTAVRCFGNVTVDGALDPELVVPIPLKARSLEAAIVALGARSSPADGNTRTLHVGPAEDVTGWSVQAHWDGWLAGVAPGNARVALGRGDCALAGIAAGAIAVGQAFLAEQGDVRAGRSFQGLSLWEPGGAPNNPGPAIVSCSFPLELWLIGLGNLGQAYLWSLSALPFRRTHDVLLFLQDDDIVKKGNWGTSILAERRHYGALKTRVVEEWAERRGFHVRRLDRRLDEHLRRKDHEPLLAISGLDRMPPRRLLGRPGFEYIVDAGLGARAANYRSLRVNCFGPEGDPAVHFAGVEDPTDDDIAALRQLPAYQQIETMPGCGSCGAATLAGQPVVVPFVSALAGAVAIAQAVRLASGDGFGSSLTADVGDLRTLRRGPNVTPRRLALKLDTPA